MSWTKIFGGNDRVQTARSFLALYVVIISTGLIVFSMLVGGFMAKLAQPDAHVIASLYLWAMPPAGISKLSSLLQYILPVAALLIYFTIYFYVSRFVADEGKLFNRIQLPINRLYLLAAVVVNVALRCAKRIEILC